MIGIDTVAVSGQADRRGRQDVCTALGRGVASGPLAPIELHGRLLGRDMSEVLKDLDVEEILVSGRIFHMLLPSPRKPDIQHELSLEGHRLERPPREFVSAISSALSIISRDASCFDLVDTFSPTFGFVRSEKGCVRPITSCTLPDFPLLSLVSRYALRHIPPSTVSPAESPYFLAENIYHESVHQYVNTQILTRGVMAPGYSSLDSPRIKVSWRKGADGQVQEWEVDRALHAATVYTNIINWRLGLIEDSSVPQFVRDATKASVAPAVSAALELYVALEANIDCFSPWGANRVGQLAERTRETVRTPGLRFRLTSSDQVAGPR